MTQNALPGSFLARYDLTDRVLGAGHFSQVLLAHDRETGLPVAVKVTEKLPGAAEGLREEVALLKRAGSHPNIVQLVDVFESPRAMFLVLELVEGGELFDRIVRRRRFPEAEARSVTRQVASALAHLHSLGVVHRDVKPENLLYTGAEDDAPIKLADFGLARSFDAAAGRHLTCPCGTPSYVAPEVIGCEGYGQAADLWSLGVILYILLCGHPPFCAVRTSELFRLIRACKYDMAGGEWRGVSAEAKTLVRRLLAADPSDRPSAEDVLRDPWVVGCALATTSANEAADGVETAVPCAGDACGGGAAAVGADCGEEALSPARPESPSSVASAATTAEAHSPRSPPPAQPTPVTTPTAATVVSSGGCRASPAQWNILGTQASLAFDSLLRSVAPAAPKLTTLWGSARAPPRDQPQPQPPAKRPAHRPPSPPSIAVPATYKSATSPGTRFFVQAMEARGSRRRACDDVDASPSAGPGGPSRTRRSVARVVSVVHAGG